MRPSLLVLALVVLGVGCASNDSKSHAPKAAPNPKCDKAYNPAICMAGHERCETDSNGCETCTCDETQPDPPGH